jgi:hypothetical protein
MKQLQMHFYRAVLSLALIQIAISAAGQTISPPVAEYRGKASGMLELRNDGDTPLAAILETNGFQVDEHGVLRYAPLDPGVKVDFGASSFVIPPHQSHYVFYKASCAQPSCWFAILSTLTRAERQQNQMRINFVLPHVVYVYQKKKLKRGDVDATVTPSANGKYVLLIQNKSDKLGRIESVESSGFEKEFRTGGVPVFPSGRRFVEIDPGHPGNKPSVKVHFEDGFSISVPVL